VKTHAMKMAADGLSARISYCGRRDGPRGWLGVEIPALAVEVFRRIAEDPAEQATLCRVCARKIGGLDAMEGKSEPDKEDQ
jgi:hypothetical protein